MANNNREISQFAGLVTVNDSTRAVTIGSTLNISGDLTLTGGDVNVVGIVTTQEVQSTNIQTSSINDGPVAGFKNKIINGNFEINQRQDTSNVGAVLTYVADRMRVRNTVDGSPTATMSTVNNSTIVDLAGGSVANIDYAAGTGTWGIIYAPERADVVSFNGKTVSVSFVTNYSSSNWVIYLQNVGGLTTAQVFTVTSSSTNPYGSTGYYVTGTVNIPSNWLASGGTEQPRLFIFNTDDFGSSTTVQFGKLQLERGPVATVFEERAYAQELALCKRYFQNIITAWATTYESGSGVYDRVNFTTKFDVEMRAAPSVSFTGNGYSLPTSSSVTPTGDRSGGPTAGTPVLLASSTQGIERAQASRTYASGNTVERGVQYRNAFHTVMTASAEL